MEERALFIRLDKAGIFVNHVVVLQQEFCLYAWGLSSEYNH